jgi:hypothetical protein
VSLSASREDIVVGGLVASFIGAVFGGFLLVSIFTWLFRKFSDLAIEEPTPGPVVAAWLVCVGISSFGAWGDGTAFLWLFIGQLGYATGAFLVWWDLKRRYDKRIERESMADTFE